MTKAYTINLGNAFRDVLGSRVLNFQLMPPERAVAVACADYSDAECTRFLSVRNLDPARVVTFRDACNAMADPMAVKSLEWSYPTSPNADAHGYPDGCYVATITKPGRPGYSVRAFSKTEFQRALDYVRGLPFEWSSLTLRIHPHYAEPVRA